MDNQVFAILGAKIKNIDSDLTDIATVVDVTKNVTNGLKNTVFGYNALSDPGVANELVAIGYEALMRNKPDGVLPDSGLYNVAIGCRAMRANTLGDHCTAIGWQALSLNTTGYMNTAIGEDALLANLVGCNNTAVGVHCLQNTLASDNTAMGNSSLQNNTTGYYNVAIGANTGIPNFGSVGSCTADAKMVFIGALSGVDKSVNTGAFNNGIAIGASALVDNSNKIQLGNSAITSVCTHGEYETQDIGDGFICKSANGTRHRISVSDANAIVVTQL